MGSLPPRLPDIQRAMGIEEKAALGFGLIGAAVGTLISLSSSPGRGSSVSAIAARS